MLKAIVVGVAVTALVVFAYVRGWLPKGRGQAVATSPAQPNLPTPGQEGGQTPAPPPEPKSGLGLFQLGDFEAAIPRLTEDLAKNKSSASHHLALATCYEKTGRQNEALAQYVRFSEACPKASERPGALVRVYQASEGAARVDAGMKLLREHPESTEAAAHIVDIANAAEKNGRPAEAWEALSLAIQIGAGNEQALVTRCVAWADALAFSPKELPGMSTIYIVKAGDVLVNIAKKHKVDAGVIERVNKIRNGAIRPGQRLKIVTAKPTLEVSIKRLYLRLHLGGKLARQYPVCTGVLDESPTPIGTFTISTRLVNPEWSRPGYRAVPYGDPENPLGTRWMGFAEPGYTSYGVHGTIKPETIGTHASNGCVRMKNEHVEELFDFVPSGTTIHIHE